METDIKEAYEQVVRLLAAISNKETFTIYELEPLLTAALGLHHESRASSDLSLSMAARSNELRTIAQHAKFMEDLGLIRCVKRSFLLRSFLLGPVYALNRERVPPARK